MKKLLLLMLIVGYTQCTTQESKQNCGIVTENVPPPGTKSSSGSIPVSYNKCEYVVIMPLGKDSFELKQYLKENNFVLQQVSEFNTSIQRYFKDDGTDTNPKPAPAPHPIIGDRILINSIGLNQQGNSVSLFNIVSRPIFNQRM